MELYCKKCSKRLTKKPLSLLKSENINYTDEKDLVPEGKYVFAKDAEFNFGIPITYLINSKSINLVEDDKGNFIGCCGPSEFDELNMVCSGCKQPVGTIIADCWTPIFIGIDANKVSESSE